eukprot:Nitzschia sp. Nitz4//scaffold245_size28976//20631//20924//NITZ4_008074-RA/size28976-processed-gene-0.15-mRNA-1//1//CDS//3329543887//601//frame0
MEENDLTTLLARASLDHFHFLQVLPPPIETPATDRMGLSNHSLFGGSNDNSGADEIDRVLEILDEALAVVRGDGDDNEDEDEDEVETGATTPSKDTQ